jgi:hypothetical protein
MICSIAVRLPSQGYAEHLNAAMTNTRKTISPTDIGSSIGSMKKP